MSNELVQLFDLGGKNCPTKSGAIFRSKQIAQCGVCEALTNKVVVDECGRYTMTCPNVSEEWHFLLAKEMARLNERASLGYNTINAVDLRECCHHGCMKNDLLGEVDLVDLRLRRWMTKGDKG